MKLIKVLAIAGALSAGSLLAAAPANAFERHRSSSVSIYVDAGNVRAGYRNGYYDHDRRWHRWRGASHRAYYRRHYGHRYHDYDYRYERTRYHRRHRDWRSHDRW